MVAVVGGEWVMEWVEIVARERVEQGMHFVAISNWRYGRL